jgi:ribosome modulation factor
VTDKTTRSPGANPGFDGMDARRAGLPCDACPYEPGPQRTAWVAGWYVAAPEKEEANESR